MLLPQSCLLCTSPHGGTLGLCAACLQDLPNHHHGCPQCALSVMHGEMCGQCLAVAPDFDATYALYRYEYTIDRMLQRYKYGQSLAMADTLGKLLAKELRARRDGALPDLLIPMPLHPQRLQERGFNQSLEIARVVAKELNIKLDSKACQRIKLAPPQASLPLKQRVKNMKGAFACHARLDGLDIALLDDVMTTGASLNALAKTVKAAGARQVECWVIARTLPR